MRKISLVILSLALVTGSSLGALAHTSIGGDPDPFGAAGGAPDPLGAIDGEIDPFNGIDVEVDPFGREIARRYVLHGGHEVAGTASHSAKPLLSKIPGAWIFSWLRGLLLW